MAEQERIAYQEGATDSEVLDESVLKLLPGRQGMGTSRR